MPYIKQNFDILISQLAGEVCKYEIEEREGLINYIISSLLSKTMKPPSGWRYKYINRVLGVLEAIKLEFYRRVVSFYEEKDIAKNGDIEVYYNK